MHTKLYAHRWTIASIIAGIICSFIFYCLYLGHAADSQRTNEAISQGMTQKAQVGQLCHGTICEPALLLTGYMNEKFAQQFLKSYGEQIDAVRWICLDSPGGSPGEGIQLAEYFQKLNKGTCVVPIGATVEAPKETKCASACAFAFAGGVKRVLANESSLGIHRAYLGDGSACIPCNVALGAVIHIGYGILVDWLVQEPAILSRVIKEAYEYPSEYVSNPSKVVRWVDKATFLSWKLGRDTEFGRDWHFVPSNDNSSRQSHALGSSGQ